jgi:hypothetical protein
MSGSSLITTSSDSDRSHNDMQIELKMFSCTYCTVVYGIIHRTRFIQLRQAREDTINT